jgi:hypothetical protein
MRAQKLSIVVAAIALAACRAADHPPQSANGREPVSSTVTEFQPEAGRAASITTAELPSAGTDVSARNANGPPLSILKPRR